LKRAVDFCGVKEGDAPVDGGMEKRDHVFLFRVGRYEKVMPMQPSRGGYFKTGGT